MKRIERNTYNSLRKSITADTINVEIPVEYTHEGRQGIHEMLTIEKHMRASMICWNSIINGYVIHYVPTVDEYTEAQRMEQEAQDIDEVMDTLPKSNRTWNGYEKPAEEQTTDTDTEEEEEEETMRDTFTPAEAAMHAATVRGIIRRHGGYRERDILNHPHTVERGETWNEAHKVIEILATTPDPDGYRPGCAVDIVTRSIVG